MADIDWGSIISAGAQIAGSYAASKAQGRAAESAINQRQDSGAQNAYATDKSLDLEALIRGYQAELDKAKGQLSEYETRLSAPQSRASNAVRGDILANVQDVGVSAPDGVNVTSFSGGLRPSLLSGNSRALGAQMSKEALLDALTGSPTPFSDMAPVDLSSITGRSAPAQTPLPQPSGMDRVMEQIGLWGGLASAGLNSQQQPNSGGWLEGHGNNVYLTPPEQTRAASLLGR
jgi:hypothetical protein